MLRTFGCAVTLAVANAIKLELSLATEAPSNAYTLDGPGAWTTSSKFVDDVLAAKNGKFTDADFSHTDAATLGPVGHSV